MATVPSPPILIWTPGGGIPVGPVSNPPVYSQSGTTPLIAGQAYVDVVFGSTQTNTNWVLVACEVFNVTDPNPLNIWPGIITNRTTAGFRLQLNGMPDSGNYYLSWAVSGINIAPTAATTYLLTGPISGGLSVASSNFTVSLPPSTTIAAPVVVTPNDGGIGTPGTFSPPFVTLTTGSPSATFTYTPAAYGSTTISATNTGPLTNPAGVAFSCVATTYTLSGPSSGSIGAASSNFTVALPVGGVVVGTVTVTPGDGGGGGGGGTFTPTTVGLTTAAPSATFTYTPVSSGAKTVSVTNNGGLTNPGNLTYTVAAGYKRSLTVDHTKVPSTQTDFPVLVNVTDATLKSVANGGHVQRSDGFDIGFYSDAGLTTKLKWEMDRYTPTTGQVIAWVKIPSLSSSADTVFYVGYGDAAITTDQSDKVNVWSNGFVAVYHLGDGTTLSVLDSKGAFNGTNSGAVVATGQIGGYALDEIAGAAFFNGASSHVGAGAPVTVPPLTISCWGAGASGSLVSVLAGAGAWNGFYLAVDPGPVLSITTVSNGFAVFGQGTKAFVTGTTWHHFAGVISAINSRIAYVDGVAGTTETTSVTPTAAPTDLTLGAVLVSGAYSNFASAYLDEVHIANVARSTNWLVTEFNNQGAPGTFITVGVET